MCFPVSKCQTTFSVHTAMIFLLESHISFEILDCINFLCLNMQMLSCRICFDRTICLLLLSPGRMECILTYAALLVV